jgi:Bifunctional DNA primase/polymerase, N-terminal.
MAYTEFGTNPQEFLKFNKLLTKDMPNYRPFYFPLEKSGKDPLFGVSWKANRKTTQEAYSLMKKGFNIGIAATASDPLVIIDVDDMKQVPEIKTTLQTISRKRIGRHNYFFAADATAKVNIPANTAGEIRSNWQYVVAPGSFVECNEEEIARMPEEEKVKAGHYSLYRESSVSTITFNEFPQAYKIAKSTRQLIDVERAVEKATGEQRDFQHSFNGKISKLWDLTITDVSGISDTHGKRTSMPLEIHDSDTQKNCSVSRGILHCWRHELSHNAFSYLCVAAGLTTCENAGMPHLGDYFGVDFTDGETVFKVWRYAKERGLIPKDDPIPRNALVYYAELMGLCKKGEKELSRDNYNLTLTLLKIGGVEHGRK